MYIGCKFLGCNYLEGKYFGYKYCILDVESDLGYPAISYPDISIIRP